MYGSITAHVKHYIACYLFIYAFYVAYDKVCTRTRGPEPQILTRRKGGT